MELSMLVRQSALVRAKIVLAKVSRFRIVFTLSSLGYCAKHWLTVHGFSFHVFLGALVFGAITATAVTLLSQWYPSSST